MYIYIHTHIYIYNIYTYIHINSYFGVTYVMQLQTVLEQNCVAVVIHLCMLNCVFISDLVMFRLGIIKKRYQMILLFLISNSNTKLSFCFLYQME